MRSQVRFFMDAADERQFVAAVVAEANTFLVNGPHWNSSAAPVIEPLQLAGAGTYLMIWNKAEVPRLRAKRMGTYWEAYNDHTTIQFLRSQLWHESILLEGSISIASERKEIEQRYKRLRKLIQQTCKNEVVCWVHKGAPVTAKNPSKPDTSAWVGAGALRWLQASKRHKFKQELRSFVEAILDPR